MKRAQLYNLKQQDMKRMKRICLIMAVACIAAGCNTLAFIGQGKGSITLRVSNQTISSSGVGGEEFFTSKSGVVKELDTNNFILSIYSDAGVKVYDGKYGKRPSEFTVIPGTYDIKLYSGKFDAPGFDAPLFGDEQSVVVGNDMSVNVLLKCRQLNGAIKLDFTSQFKIKFPGSGVELRDTKGSFLYPYNSGKYCYVEPGAVELYYKTYDKDTLLCTRRIEQSQMLSLKLSYAPGNSHSSNLSIEMDTARVWSSEGYNVGHKIPTGAFTIEQAKGMVGEKGVTVFGFILGGDASETAMRIAPPFSSKTNIVIAPSMLERNRNNCFVVELPSGSVRDGLNLVTFPDHLGKAVILTGNIVESYYGFIGMKATKAFTILY